MGHYDVTQGKYVEDAPDATAAASAPSTLPVGVTQTTPIEADIVPVTSAASAPSAPAAEIGLAGAKQGFDENGANHPVIDAIGSALTPLSPLLGTGVRAVGDLMSPDEKPSETAAKAAAATAAASAPSAAVAPEAPATPEAPPPPEVKTVTKSPEVTKHITNALETQADKEVAAAVAQGAKAIGAENDLRTKQAEVEQAKADIENTKAKQEAINANAALKEGIRRKADIDTKAKADENAYRAAAAAGDKGFWGSQDVQTKKAWSLSLMFGSVAVAFGADENPGQKLLDKTMANWVSERDKKLERLEKQATKSGGLQEAFWGKFGDEVKAKKQLQDAAAYLTVADQIDAMNAKMRALIPDKAFAANASAAAEYRQKAANAREAVVQQRFDKDTVKSGGTEVTMITGKPEGGAGGARGIADARMRATLAEKGREALGIVDALTAKGVKLDETDRVRMQKNRQELERISHDPSQFSVSLKQGLGWSARSDYEGLTDDKKNLAQALETLQQSWAGLASPSHAEDEMKHTRALMNLTGPGADAAYENNLKRARGMIGAQGALAGPVNAVAEKGARAGVAAAPARAPAAPAGVRQTRRFPDGSVHTGTLLASGSFQAD